jgi:formylglycine-generating enzyme required for sulfatase activity
MFIIGQPRISSFCFVLFLTLFLLPQTIWAEEFRVILPGGIPMTLVKVPAGTFLMGSPSDERGNNLGNETQHQVTLTHDYYLGKTEVTMDQWKAVTGLSLPTECYGRFGRGVRPASCVSWNQITGPGGFVEKLNQHLETTGFRLPTEAEWERAARAGTTTRYAHGDVLECNDQCYDVDSGACQEHLLHMWYCGFGSYICIAIDSGNLNTCLKMDVVPQMQGVAITEPNAFGLYDMHGNVWEWVQDRYGDYSPQDITDPTGPAVGIDRVIRGGSWAGAARLGRSASRASANPETFGIPANSQYFVGTDGFGFRIAISSVEDLGIQINAGLNDAWYNPLTDGQGFLITVFPDIQEMFVAWFTYDTERPPENVTAILGEPGHRWLTAQGPYEGNTANLTIYVTEGGVFDSAEPATSTDLDGDGILTLEFADCSEGLVSYEITSLGISGEIPIQRIVPDNISLCESLDLQ